MNSQIVKYSVTTDSFGMYELFGYEFALKKIHMKYNLAEMNALDLYLSSLTNTEYEKIKSNIGSQESKSMTLMSWDFFMQDYHKRMAEATKRTELEQVLSFAQKFNWQNDLNSAFSENDYDALIITDKNQKIIWVNNGFTSMTGYSKKTALDQTPGFLQGHKTSKETKDRIRKKIQLNKPFTDIIINHRQDQSVYECELKIFPLYNEKTSHYIAFEKQIG
jgi:PAS domain S-box-containing protein